MLETALESPQGPMRHEGSWFSTNEFELTRKCAVKLRRLGCSRTILVTPFRWGWEHALISGNDERHSCTHCWGSTLVPFLRTGCHPSQHDHTNISTTTWPVSLSSRLPFDCVCSYDLMKSKLGEGQKMKLSYSCFVTYLSTQRLRSRSSYFETRCSRKTWGLFTLEWKYEWEDMVSTHILYLIMNCHLVTCRISGTCVPCSCGYLQSNVQCACVFFLLMLNI